MTHGSLIETSTFGGIERGVRPSFDGRVAVAENGRVVVVFVVWKAGTRKLGNVTTEEDLDDAAIALPKALPPLTGASILGRCFRRIWRS